MGKLNLVRYAGDYWVTLADFTQTRDTTGYSDHASVKSAIRTFIVKQNPDKYIAFRGELQLKNIIQENRNNPMFDPKDFQGTRMALIHFSMIDSLNERFSIEKSEKNSFNQFMEEAEDVIEKDKAKTIQNNAAADSDIFEGRSTVLRQLRNELSRIDKEIELRGKNRERILQAINAMESLEIEDLA